jgi:hypothetical protein
MRGNTFSWGTGSLDAGAASVDPTEWNPTEYRAEYRPADSEA